jgi:hypothetical protein
MLNGMTFIVPVGTVTPETLDATLKAFPKLTDKKIPMRCQYRPELNQWECDIAKWYERRAILAGIGGGVAAFFLGVFIGRARK